MCMYVYIYIYMHIHVYIYIYIYTHMYTCNDLCSSSSQRGGGCPASSAGALPSLGIVILPKITIGIRSIVRLSTVITTLLYN